QATVHHRRTAVHAVERISVADQDAQRSFRSGGRNPYGNLAYEPLATIRTNHGLHHNLVARTSFRHVRARSFQTGRAAFADKIEIKPHALNVGSVERIAINAPKALADGGSGQSRRGLPVVLRGKHVPQRHFGIAFHAEHALHAVSDVLAVLVSAV